MSVCDEMVGNAWGFKRRARANEGTQRGIFEVMAAQVWHDDGAGGSTYGGGHGDGTEDFPPWRVPSHRRSLTDFFGA